MRDVLPRVDAWTAEGARVALATVVGVRFSAPRPLGAKLAISDRGDVAGAVSGGCVEASVVRAGRELLDGDGPGRLLSFGIADDEAWAIGLPCGGEIDVWIDRHDDDALAAAARAGHHAARVTALAGPAPGARLHLAADGTTSGSLGRPTLDLEATEAARELLGGDRCGSVVVDGTPLFVDVVAPDPRLVVVGGGDLTLHLCAVARATGWRTVVVDPRSLFTPPGGLPHAERVVDAWPQDAFPLLHVGPADAVVVLTHDPKLDDAAILAALRAGAGFVGALGSRHAQTARRRRLAEHGVPDDEIARIAGPIGLDLGATATPETALSILAEVVAARHGRDGGPLRHAAGRIHELR